MTRCRFRTSIMVTVFFLETLVAASSALSKPVVARTSTGLSKLQTQAATVALSFKPDEDFDPLLTNCHVQTIMGFLGRSPMAYLPRNRAWPSLLTKLLVNPSTENSFWDQRQRIETPDGDWFHVDTKFGSFRNNNNNTANNTRTTVLLLHGLQSSSNASMSRDLAAAVVQYGMNCVCLNFRGCSGEPNDRLGGYHLGFTDDLVHYLNTYCRNRTSPIYLVGFSLGGNVILKCLGELGASVQDYQIAGAGVMAVPMDQTKNALVVAQPGMNRDVYSAKLLQTLRVRAKQMLERLCDNDANTKEFDYQRVLRAKTIAEFDDAVISPIYGFIDCWDYYERTSSIHFLETIAVPTLIINAEDDPLLDPVVWPTHKTVCDGGNAPIRMMRTKHGGHLGYCFHQVDENDPRLEGNRPSWASWQIGRFLNHVHNFDQNGLGQ